MQSFLGERFAPLTFPRLRKFVTKLTPPWLAAVATQDGHPVGLALGYHEEGVASLLSVFVDRAHKRTGLGAALLRAWEAEAQRLGAHTAAARFSEALPRREAFSALLRSAGWGEPAPAAYRLTGLVGKMKQQGGQWKSVRRILARTDIACGPFVLTPEDNGSVDRLLRQPEAKEALDPRTLVDGALAATSCTIRRSGHLVGWIVANRAPAGVAALSPCALVIEYREMYVDARLWNRGIALAAIHFCFSQQERHFGADSIATYNNHPGRPWMVAMTLRRFAPIALHVRAAWEARKQLTPPYGPRYQIEVARVPGERFAPLTFPRLREFVAQLTPPSFAATATLDGEPVGLALGFHQDGVARLLSLFVAPPHRRAGVGAALLQAWEAEARRLEAQTVTARFTDALPRRDAFRALLRSANWAEPSPVGYRLTGIVGRMTKEVGRWKGLRRVLAQTDITYGPLVLTPQDDPAIERLLRQPEAEGAPDPRPLVAGALAAPSCTIRQEGKLAGWIVANRASEELAAAFPGSVVIDYREMYIDARLWSRGVALAATYLCFVEQEREFGAESIATYNTHPGRPRMVALTLKRYAPMALHVRTVWKAKKELTLPSG